MKKLSALLSIIAYKIHFRFYRLLHGKPQAYLRRVNGVIHIGASTGQERDNYSRNNLNVLWIEAIPEVYLKLVENLEGYPYQRALNYLLDSSNSDDISFNVASNSGESSSLLELEDHKAMYPDVIYVKSIALSARTLDWLIENETVDMSLYDTLILDVQGAELRVLKGAKAIIKRMRYVEVEVADFRAYKDCPILSEMTDFMEANAFNLDYLQRVSFVPGIGSYYNAIYKSINA